MKPTLVFVLLVLFLYTVCGELAETSAVRSLSQSRRLQEVSEVFGAGSGEVKNVDGKKCDPVPYVDFGFERYGEEFAPTAKVVGASACLASCPSHIGCVALNYYADSRLCATLKSVTGIQEQTEKLARTLLVKFNNDYVCDPGNFVPGYHRAGHDYTNKTEIESPEECCKKCLEEDLKCVAWDYSVEIKTCFLKDVVPVFKKSQWGDNVTTGLGGFCPPESSLSST